MNKMISYRSITVLASLAVLGLLAPQAASLAQGDRHRSVHALFDLATPAGGPFPSNWFTVRDRTQNTRLRVNLPHPDCNERPSDCEDIDVLNELDGFNMQPRLSIPFDGPIDVHSVSSRNVFLISLGDTLDRRDRGGRVCRHQPDRLGRGNQHAARGIR